VIQPEVTMANRLQAACGLVCSSCPAYLAKKTDDDALRAKTAQEWARPDAPIRPEEVNCDGCTALGGERWTFCDRCEVRVCASSRHIATCADCDDYACRKLDRLLVALSPVARANLEALRAES
jgi:hypothetical protein